MQIFLGTLAQVGMQIGAVTPGEWAHAAQKLLLESGIKDPQSYVLDPEIVKQQFFMQMQQQMQLQEQQQAAALLSEVAKAQKANNTNRFR